MSRLLLIASMFMTACTTGTPSPVAPAQTAPVTPPPSAPSEPMTLNDLIPAGWQEEQKLDVDFNADGINDVAMVIHTGDTKPTDGSTDRKILVALGATGGFLKPALSSCLAYCKDCGGVFGDPFGGVQVVGKSSVQVMNYGGSNHRWSVSYTFMWHEQQFQVVGIDESSFTTSDPDNMDEKSINLLSGKYHLADKKTLKAHTQKPTRFDDCQAIEAIRSAVQ